MKNKNNILIVLAVLSALCTFAVVAQDLRSNLDIAAVIVPTTGAADITSAAIDSRNYKTQLLNFYVTANASWSATDKLDFIVTHCLTSNGTFTPVVAQDIQGATPDANGKILTLAAPTTAATMQKIQYVGRMPYIKVKADFTGTLNVATPTVAVFSIQGGKIIAGQ
jgi:Cu/Zn superoxide dismutase